MALTEKCQILQTYPIDELRCTCNRIVSGSPWSDDLLTFEKSFPVCVIRGFTSPKSYRLFVMCLGGARARVCLAARCNLRRWCMR